MFPKVSWNIQFAEHIDKCQNNLMLYYWIPPTEKIKVKNEHFVSTSDLSNKASSMFDVNKEPAAAISIQRWEQGGEKRKSIVS